jgi:hypothetical protein
MASFGSGTRARARTHTHTHTHTHIYIYIYIYIELEPWLSITRGNPGSTVPSGSAAPGSGGYKSTPRPSGIRF